MACAKLDPETEWEKLEPLVPFLDNAFLLPCHISVNKSVEAQVYLNMTLSYRGSERQAPSVLSLALQFSHVMAHKASHGLHDGSWNTEKRLRDVVNELHDSDGFLAKWGVDDMKFKAILNMLIGTSESARNIVQAHLHHHKWQFSAFTSELLRNSRWLIGATPAKAAEGLKAILTMDEKCQVWFLKLHISTFLNAIRRVKQSSRAKCRASVNEWERTADYTCVMRELWKQAREFLKDDEPRKLAVVKQLKDCLLSRPGCSCVCSNCSHQP